MAGSHPLLEVVVILVTVVVTLVVVLWLHY